MTAIPRSLEMALRIPSLLLSAAVVVLMVLSSPGTEGGDSPSKCGAGLSRASTLEDPF